VSVDDVLSRFRDARRDGSGWAAKCPAHDDQRASVTISTGADGRVLLHCHAGCTLDAILDAVHLETRDLFPAKRSITTPTKTIVACYDYADENGAVLYQAVRYDPKGFRQRRADGAGGWIWNVNGTRRVLFGLPELSGQKVVYVVEGEKDVLALRAIGLVATTNAGGAGKWRGDYAAQLAAAGVQRVIVLPDNDPAGRQHAEAVARSCDAAGLQVKIIALPDLPPKGDVSDWLAAHTREKLTALLIEGARAAAGSEAGSVNVPTSEAPPADAIPGVVFDEAFLARAKADPGVPFGPAVVTRLAALTRAEYELCRAQLKKVGVRGAELDKAIKEHKAAQADARLEQEAIERQADARAREARRAELAAERTAVPDPSVDLGALLHEIMTWVRRYVVLTVDQAIAVVVWIAHTHAIDAADCTPYLQITSATKRAGKTRLLEVLEPLVARPWLTGRTTAAALVRRIDKDRSTLLLDESDAAFNGEKEYAEALRGVLNSGYRRSGKATVCVGHGAEITTQDFRTFSPKGIAGIGKLPDTVADRSIPVALRRRTDSEPCERWRERDGHQQAASLRTRLAAWARGAVAELREARPDVPIIIGDRLADVWEPLLAIADSARGEWPTLARRAAIALAGVAVDTDPTVELLIDIAEILDGHDGAFIGTKGLIEKLVAREERSWATWRHDKPITPSALAGLLGPLEIHPKPSPDGRSRGYRVDAFDDAIARYLPLKVSERQNASKDAPETPLLTRQSDEPIDTSKKAETPTPSDLFDGLTLRSGESGPLASVSAETVGEDAVERAEDDDVAKF
jgi:hypothetical protein